MRFADDVPSGIPATIGYALRRHVVDVSHVVLETRDAPPESERVREPGRSFTIEGGCHGAVCLLCVELFLREVAWFVEFCDFTLQCPERLAEFFRRCLTTDRNRPCVIQRVVIDADRFPQPTVDQALLKQRLRIIEHV